MWDAHLEWRKVSGLGFSLSACNHAPRAFCTVRTAASRAAATEVLKNNAGFLCWRFCRSSVQEVAENYILL